MFLLHETEIPNPNDFWCVTIGRRPVIVTRTADGEIRALMNRCTHRGTVICVKPQGNTTRFLEDFTGFGYRDDNEIFERIQQGLGIIREMEWVDFSKGLGTDRETTGADGAITGNVSDETGIRGAYAYWKVLMCRDFQPQVLI